MFISKDFKHFHSDEGREFTNIKMFDILLFTSKHAI